MEISSMIRMPTCTAWDCIFERRDSKFLEKRTYRWLKVERLWPGATRLRRVERKAPRDRDRIIFTRGCPVPETTYYHWVAFWQNSILDFLLSSSLTSKLIQILRSRLFCYIHSLNFLFHRIWPRTWRSSLRDRFLTSFWQISLMPHVWIQIPIGPSVVTAPLARGYKLSRPSGA